MLVRAVLAFLAMPGMVAFALPWLWLRGQGGAGLARPWGLLVLAAGAAALLWCVRDFYVRGRGTLAPWAPPTTLVVGGLYRYSRNPMYLAVLAILAGWALAFDSAALGLYGLFIATAFHLRVVLGEEPWLERTHGPAWHAYTQRVRRWF